MEALNNNKSEGDEMLQAQIHLYKHIFNYINSMSLKCAVILKIPDIIHNHGKPITLSDLVSSLNLNPSKTPYIFRLMRLLVHSKIFAQVRQEQEREQQAYDLTPTSKLLLQDGTNNLSPFVMSMLHEDFSLPFHVLGDWFQDNQDKEMNSFEKAHGVSFWEHNKKSPVFSSLFNEAMACDSQMMNLVIRDCKSVFKGLDSLVDVGGGNGSLARIISETFPNIKCTVLELPQVVGNLKGSENLSFVGGDMFHHIPSADAIILKLVMHGWNDEECVKILKNCRQAISGKGEEAKVMIIDIVIDEKISDNSEDELTEAKLLFDMLMMVVVTGRERTEKEWERLFMEAGFSQYKITPLLGLRSLIEVYP